MINIQILTVFIFSLLTYSSALSATEFDKSYIEEFAKSYIEQNVTFPAQGKVKITVSKLDPRIVIKPCFSPLSANIPENSKGRNVNIKISCSDSTPWQLHLYAKIKTLVPVLVATSKIGKGSVLDNNNIDVILKDQATLRGETMTNDEGIIGAKAKRSISKGSSITKRNICLVCKGETVTIIAKSNSFIIKTAGTALSNGGIGDQVSVKNTRSGRTISAQVKAINKVVITL